MRLLALSLLAALLAFGADVTGKWKGSYETGNGAREVTFTFQLADGKLTGTAGGPQGTIPINDCKLDGDNISFVIQTDNFKAVVTGTVSGDDMKLVADTGDNKVEIAAKRIKE